MGKETTKKHSPEAMHTLSFTKGMPATGIAARAYFAACARHASALALFGLMLCPVPLMANNVKMASVVLPSGMITETTDSIGSSESGKVDSGDTSEATPDTIPYSRFLEKNYWMSPSQEAGTTNYQAWEIVCQRPTKLSLNYTCVNYYHTFKVTLNDSTLIERGNWNNYSNKDYEIVLPAGRHTLRASYYSRNDNIYEEGETPSYYAEMRLAIADDQLKATAYLGALDDKAGLKQELQTALDNYSVDPKNDALYAALSAAYNKVCKAYSYAALIEKDLVVADSILNVGAYVDISEAVALGRALNAETSTSEDYIAAFEALETSIAVQVTSNMSVDDWTFNTNSYVGIDDYLYYLDTDNKVAAFAGFSDSNIDVENLVIPSTVRYNNETYAVVCLYNNRYREQRNIRTITLPRTLRQIADYGLAYYYGVTDIEIPSNVERMGQNVFYYDTSLKNIKVNAVVPPTLGSLGTGRSYHDNYDDYEYTKYKITIPRESFHAYRLVSAWNTNYNVLIGGDEGVTVSTGKLAAGDLGHVVVEEAGYLQEVNKLIIEGELNSDDWSKISQMTNLTELDLSKALIDEIPNSAFSGRWAINKVELPSTLKKRFFRFSRW